MSNINFSNIDKTFPISGKDNSTQGFRDNFTAIYNGFETAADEITKLQNRTLLSGSLTDNSSVINYLNNSVISYGRYAQFNGVVYQENNVIDTTMTIDNGPFQVYTLSNNAIISLDTVWTAGVFSQVRLHLKSNGVGNYNVTFNSIHNLHYGTGYPSPLTTHTNLKHQVVDIWTYDGGTNLFLKYQGEF